MRFISSYSLADDEDEEDEDESALECESSLPLSDSLFLESLVLLLLPGPPCISNCIARGKRLAKLR